LPCENLDRHDDRHDRHRQGDPMRVSKRQVVDFIRERGDGERAERAESELPDVLDLPADEATLLEYGVNPIDLAGDEPDHAGASPRGESGEAADDADDAEVADER
jgi:hypothetical protein